MSRLNVLVFPARYPSPARPYLATFHREHVRAISRYHDVVVLDAPREESTSIRKLFLVERSMEDTVDVVHAQYRRSPIPKTTLFLHVFSAVSAYRQIVRSGFRPDLIHAHMYFVALTAVVLGKLFRVPVLIAEHSECFATSLPGRIRMEAKFAMGMADMLIPDSHSLKAQMESQGIRGRFHVIHNPVDTEFFRPSPIRTDPKERPSRLLFVGRLASVKGIPTMLRGLAILKQRRGDFTLNIVGDGDGRNEYESLARRLGLEREVVFHSNVPRESLAAFMRSSHAFVLSSLSENCPCVLIEALASGLPVITSDVGGVREVVPEGMGVFFPRENPKALADALSLVLDNLNSFDPLALAEYARDNFSLEVIGERIDSVYRQILARRR
jgi:glycosyltransferase involved in cell wall biosynthesis